MNSQEIQNRLGEVQVLRGLTYPVLRRIVQQGRLLEVKAGEIIVGPRFGTKGAFVILEGSVSVVLPFGPVVSYLEKGKLFGEIALLDGVERSAYCKAYSDCLLFEIPFGTFHADLATNSVARSSMEELAVNRLNTNQAIRDGSFLPDPVPPEPELVEAEMEEDEADGESPAADGGAEKPQPPAVYATA